MVRFLLSLSGVISVFLGLWAAGGVTTGLAAEEGEKAAESKPAEEMVNSIGMKLRLIPAGSFLMGSTSEFGRLAHEYQHEVEITKAFYLGAFEVTQAEYEKVVGSNPSYFSETGAGKDAVAGMDCAGFPVESVSWEDAMEFCRRLSELPAEKAAGRSYRLPTEAEWEYACRAGTTTVYHYGESLSSSQANFDGNYPYLEREDVLKGEDPKKLKGPYLKRPTTVGAYAPNAWGLFDMHGNVWEWVADWYSPVYFKDSPVKDPAGPEEGTSKVSRGGGWYYFAAGCRSASRYERPPADRRNTDGFRVVCIQGEPAKQKAKRF